MKLLLTLFAGVLLTISLFGQNDKIKELVSQGTSLHDEGKYDDAIAKYKAALDIDDNSSLANYELSYTYMTIKKYDDAIKYSKKVVAQNSAHQQLGYIVWGTSLDMKGYPKEAIKAYEEGLMKFPYSNLLNYNLALTAYNIGDYEKARPAVQNAILAKPEHGSSHLLLANIMIKNGERVKALLSFYYFLLLEPSSKRSLANLNILKSMLNLGVEKQSGNKINVTIPSLTLKDSAFGAAEMMVSLSGVARYEKENKGKSENVFFAETNKNLFSVLGELKKDNKNIWWDLYVTKFNDLVESGNCEAFSYYISQSTNSVEVNNWITNNPDKMQSFKGWMKKQKYPAINNDNR
jgi:tetratricopeptide (TPR) repeat protein